MNKLIFTLLCMLCALAVACGSDPTGDYYVPTCQEAVHIYYGSSCGIFHNWELLTEEDAVFLCQENAVKANEASGACPNIFNLWFQALYNTSSIWECGDINNEFSALIECAY